MAFGLYDPWNSTGARRWREIEERKIGKQKLIENTLVQRVLSTSHFENINVFLTTFQNTMIYIRSVSNYIERNASIEARRMEERKMEKISVTIDDMIFWRCRTDSEEKLRFLVAFNNSSRPDSLETNLFKFVRGYSSPFRIPKEVINIICFFTFSREELIDADTIRPKSENRPIEWYADVYDSFYGVLEGDACRIWIRKEWRVEIMDYNPDECVDFSIGVIGAEKSSEPLVVDVKEFNLQIGDVISMLFWVPIRSMMVGDVNTANLTITVNDVETTKIWLSEIPQIEYSMCIILKNYAKIRMLY